MNPPNNKIIELLNEKHEIEKIMDFSSDQYLEEFKETAKESNHMELLKLDCRVRVREKVSKLLALELIEVLKLYNLNYAEVVGVIEKLKETVDITAKL